MIWDQKLSSGCCSRPSLFQFRFTEGEDHFEFAFSHGVGVLALLCYWPFELGVSGWLQVVVIGLLVLETDIFTSSTIEFNIINLAEPGTLHDSGLCRFRRVRGYDW